MTWPQMTLGQLGQWSGGGTPSKSRADFWAEGDVPWLSPKDMKGDVAQTRDHITQTAVEHSSVRRVPANSVAIVVRSGILEHTLPVSVIPFETTLNQDMKSLTTQMLEPRWIMWAIRCFEQDILRTCRKAGTTVASLEFSRLKDYQIPVPGDRDQQRRIVEILEGHLSRLDAADADLNLSSRRLQVLIKSELASRIPGQDRAPMTWRWTTVAGAGRVELGRQRHPDWHTGANMHPYLRVANVFEDRIDTSDLMEMHWPGATFERFRLNPGDVLLNEGQSPELLGRPALYRGDPPNVAFTNSLLRFVANDQVLPEFALLVFRRHMHTGRFRRESRITTNIGHLSATRLKTIEFPISPLPEQKRIVEETRERLSDISRLKPAIEAASSRSRALRRAVLAAAFSGRLTGRRTDDEIIEEMAR